jgi:hypothetical protein
MVGAQALQDNPVTNGTVVGTVVAAIPCDGPYDLSGTMIPGILSSAPEPAPFYVPYMIFGYNSVYGADSDFNFATVFKPGFATSLPPLFDGTHGSAEINAAMPASHFSKDVLSEAAIAALNPLNDPLSDLYRKLQLSDAYRGWAFPPSMDIQMIQCLSDDVIPSENAVNAYNAFTTTPNPHILPVINVAPIPVAGVSVTDQVHVRAFPSAILRGFQIIAGHP